MNRYVALLRAINVGGHNLKMSQLREQFEALGFSKVATFIASGNVIFDSPAANAAELERQIEGHLKETLGYEVATFIRSPAELAAIAACEPFPAADLDSEGTSMYITFLPETPAAEARQTLMDFRTKIDDFAVEGREVYWLCRKRMSDSTFSGALLEKTLGMPATMRNANTIRRLVGKVHQH